MRKLDIALALSLTATALLVQDAPANAAPTVTTSPAATPKTFTKPSKKLTVKNVANLSVQDRLDLLRMTIKAEFTEDQLLAPTTLSVRKPYVDEHTAMDFYGARQVLASSNRAIFDEYQYPDILFRSAAGQSYVVECKVSIDYKVKKLAVYAVGLPATGSGATKTLIDSDLLVDEHKVAFVLQPNGLYNVEFGLWGDGTWMWDFQSCKITPVKL